MIKLTGSLVTFPARVTLAGYLLLITIGSILLYLPISHAPDRGGMEFSDSVFTATSAVCVTGLVVQSTGHDFSFFGQCVILVLIQFGGIGIMTVTTYVILNWQRQQSLLYRQMVSDTVGPESQGDLSGVLFRIIGLTLLFEGIGFAILAIRFCTEFPIPKALWHALFHSVSAFCNAGFSLNDNSLMPYRLDLIVNFAIIMLVLVGGIGYPVLLDLQRSWRKHKAWSERWKHLQLHSKLMLLGTGTLLLLGTLAVLFLEWDGVLADVPMGLRPLVAFFHSVTCRTAGFNTVDVSSLTNATLFISVLFMAIGAGPGSTAGGFKVSTITILVLRAWATFRGHTSVRVFRRTIPREVISRAITTAMLFFVVAVVALTTFLVVEQSGSSTSIKDGRFLGGLFEIVSALGTVGLSTGITDQLTQASRLILVVLMLIGRLGPISIFAALSHAAHDDPIEYPSEEPLIG